MSSKVLFEDGDWRIAQPYANTLETAIYHRCQDPNMDSSWWHISMPAYCVSCDEKIPDPILGLWQLHTWER